MNGLKPFQGFLGTQEVGPEDILSQIVVKALIVIFFSLSFDSNEVKISEVLKTKLNYPSI